MSFVKPYIPVLLMGPEDPALEVSVEKRDYIIGMELNLADHDQDNLGRLIRGDCPFMVVINDRPDGTADDFTDEMTEYIELCMFSKNYIQVDNNPVIAIASSLPLPAIPGVLPSRSPAGELSRHLREQGWPALKQWVLPMSQPFREQIRGKKDVPLFLDRIDFDETFLLENFLSDPENLCNYIFFKDPEKKSTGSIEQEFAELCASAIGKNDLWEKNLREYMSLKNAFTELSEKNHMLQERLDNAEKTVSVIKTKYKDDYDNLFKWYQKEYEVLPLWYKRFGHIVKVCMGERTLRSLFDDSDKGTAS